MKLSELFTEWGKGVMATSDALGIVNTAIYARPHVVDEATVAWGMTEGRTHQNIVENPHAAYLFLTGDRGFVGCRLTLKLLKIEESGEMLKEIRLCTERAVNPAAALAIRYAVWFTVTEIRPAI
jgi:hypothetical protein